MPHDHHTAHDHQPAPTGAACCTPDVVPQTARAAVEGGRSFHVSGLDCADEAEILRRAIGPAAGGAGHLAFDVMNGRMTVLESAAPVTDAQILRLVAATGMRASPWDDTSARADQAAHFARQRRFTALSGGFLLAGILWHLVEAGPHGALTLFAGHGGTPMPTVEVALYLLAVAAGLWIVAPKAWAAARALAPDMNLLMVFAVAGAIGLGDHFEAATVAFLFVLSLTLESWSVGRARNAVSALLDLAPPTARLVHDDGSTAVVPAADVAPGARIVVRAGDRIALDGRVVEGAGAVDQAPITGESAPVAKAPGDEVYAGTINGEGALTVEVTHAADDTTLARIIRMVGSAQSRRAGVEQWVTRFARVYTPVVMGLAVLIALAPPLLGWGAWGDWFYRALVLLVIACPCALVISTPVSIVAAMASAARNGILVKGGAWMEAPARLEVLAVDKTGTLTSGAPQVRALHPLAGASVADLLATAAALEARSSHPLARAILTRAEADGVPATVAADLRTVPGRGLEGEMGGEAVWLGSPAFAAEKAPDVAAQAALAAQVEALEADGSTLVVVGRGVRILGLVELADTVRPAARAVVARLHALGVRRIVMLTGDNEAAARKVAREVGIDEVRAGLLPEGKVAAIEDLVAGAVGRVAMLGDGVNDAPAMARAHFAIAMGAIGSDAAIETADIALMTDDLARLPELVAHSRRTLAIVRQNITGALATKALFVGLTAFGLASMWGAIAADVGVSLLVVANGLRLLHLRREAGADAAPLPFAPGNPQIHARA